MERYVEGAKSSVSKVWSYLTFISDKKAKLTGQSSDGREIALLTYVQQNAEKGNAESVLSAIDDFSHHTWLMTVGKEKGSILESAVQKFQPRLALELGTYCGYSAIKIALKMTKPGSKLVSVEMNPLNSEVATAIIDHAGLSSKVEVLEGTLTDVCDELGEILDEMGAIHFDFIFLDHFKHCYLPDFLMLKEKGMLGKGTGIVADSIGFLGASNYLKYIREHGEEMETEEVMSSVEFMSWLPCTMTVSTYKADLHKFLTE
ncbi:hypothetical protein SUGI_0677710 [Cryptomeria japonica]|uniref:uncharacterized protein LOC131069340 n=1 Tax=Cryptomeria japonica TaxID=3369 RepID=UPI002414A36C|nr:uncharacterized protein LOC131069340 [Cryptomeria japonica]GLJ33710.1 hypothetical protein SUGI_0677710 [Cryptomeria japonica]